MTDDEPRAVNFRREYGNWDGLRTVCLTIDVDFAPDYMIDHVIDILEPYEVAATFFATHPSRTMSRLAHLDRYEIGFHPNLSTTSTQGRSLTEIIGKLRLEFPKAVGNRFHLLGHSYRDLAALGGLGLVYDASTLRFNADYLLPTWHRDIGMTLLTYFWEDGICEASRIPLTLRAVNLYTPGMKIFNFHPLNIYLNGSDETTRLTFLHDNPDLTDCPQETAERYRRPGDGAETLLRSLLAEVSSRKARFVRLAELVSAHRETLPAPDRSPVTGTRAPDDEPRHDGISAFHRATKPDDLIQLASADAVGQKRADLIRYLGGDGHVLTRRLPDRYTRNVIEPRFAGLTKVGAIDRIVVEMPHGVESTIFLLHAAEPNTGVVLYHHGHTHQTETAVIQRFLDAGYSVLVLWMPLMGPNTRPVDVDSPRFGRLRIDRHADLALLAPSITGSPIRYFVEPVIVGLNQLTATSRYRTHDMVGLSGGGWTTTICAAVDGRIRRSYPVAGTLPIWLRMTTTDWPSGDYEENDVGLYATANYLELYVLGSHGSDRGQIQILNRYDSCCFRGMRHLLYADVVAASVTRLGPGRFTVYCDESHREHIVSPTATDLILADMIRP